MEGAEPGAAVGEEITPPPQKGAPAAYGAPEPGVAAARHEEGADPEIVAKSQTARRRDLPPLGVVQNVTRRTKVVSTIY